MERTVKIKKVAVLGAGVMGAQIATHCMNAGIQAILFDLAGSDERNKNSIVEKSLKTLKKLKPAPAADSSLLSSVEVANYNDDCDKLADCDLIIEAVSEKLDIKRALYEKISPYLADSTIIASNTSGLSIHRLSEFLPEKLRSHFCGVHFFNPPRYMALVELIASDDTNPEILDGLESFLTSHLGKRVIRAKDTPNFIANRIGVFSMLVTLKHTEDYNLPIEVVDALTGPIIGRAKSATYRTADVVGLDTFKHVVATMQHELTNDPWHKYFELPAWLNSLIEQGALGQKTKAGVYRKEGKQINVFDYNKNLYRPSTGKADKEVMAVLSMPNPVERMRTLRDMNHPEAQFVWAIYRDLFHYCAHHCEDIANSVRDLDLAIRWGFGWKQGPFETWQACDWQSIANMVSEDIADEKAMVAEPLPSWVTGLANKGVYSEDGAYSPKNNKAIPRSNLAVYKRQPFPDAVLAEIFDEGETIFENEVTRLWTTGDDIAILSFKTKLCTIGNQVLDSLVQAIEITEEKYKAMVIWQRHSEHFSAGANLKEFVEVIKAGDYQTLDATLSHFQQACLRLKYATVPTIAAAKGYVFGGGCELLMQCSRSVSALETYLGLVEAGVGLLPAGGGCKEMAERAAKYNRDPYDAIEAYFKQIAMGMVSGSAREAKTFGYLAQHDQVVMHPEEILYVAKHQASATAESAYVPELKKRFPVAGRQGIARLKTLLVNMQAGAMISEHDNFIAERIATVLCGGDIDAGCQVEPEWILKLERDNFIELAQTPKTLERIEHMLKTGKPLRN